MTEIQGGAWAGFQAQLASKQHLCAHSSSATSWKPEQKGPDHCVAAIIDPTWSQSSQALPMAGSRLIMRRTEAKMQDIEVKSWKLDAEHRTWTRQLRSSTLSCGPC